MNLDLQKLRKIAEDATDGPWVLDNHGTTICTTISVNTAIQMDDGTEYPAMDWIIGHMQVSNCPNFMNDAQFIATFNPKVVLWLLDRIGMKEEAEEKCEQLTKEDIDLLIKALATVDIEFGGVDFYEEKRSKYQAVLLKLKRLWAVEDLKELEGEK